MKRNNILILSAGRRVKLVEFFQSAAKRHLKGAGIGHGHVPRVFSRLPCR